MFDILAKSVDPFNLISMYASYLVLCRDDVLIDWINGVLALRGKLLPSQQRSECDLHGLP